MNFVLWQYIRVGDPNNNEHIWQNAAYDSVLADMQNWLTRRIAYLDSTFAGTVFEIGDVNMDDSVDTYDAVLILRYVSGYVDDDFNIQYADIDADGIVDSFDAALLLRQLAGILD